MRFARCSSCALIFIQMIASNVPKCYTLKSNLILKNMNLTTQDLDAASKQYSQKRIATWLLGYKEKEEV